MSYVKLTYHFVWRTYCSEPSIPETYKIEMQKYLNTLCQSYKLFLREVNMHLDHVHLLVDVPATLTVAWVAQEVKAVSSGAFLGHPNFPLFKGWNKGYAAFTVSHWDIPKVEAYIKNQSEHHKHEDTRCELLRWLSENGIDDQTYLDRNM
ncbi:MAG: IS200/IS605 family transposase [Bacteroidales bacterium]|nr:IS200/IS605 family transposase [Bacteroidales bacterium]